MYLDLMSGACASDRSWQPSSVGFEYQSESILKDDCLHGVSHGQAQSEGLREALELECSLMEEAEV